MAAPRGRQLPPPCFLIATRCVKLGPVLLQGVVEAQLLHARQRPPPSLGAACRDAGQRFRRRRCGGRRGRLSRGRSHALSSSVPGPTLHGRTPVESGAVGRVPQNCVRCVLTWTTPSKPRVLGVSCNWDGACVFTLCPSPTLFATVGPRLPCSTRACFSVGTAAKLSTPRCHLEPLGLSPSTVPDQASTCRPGVPHKTPSLAQVIHQLSLNPAN